MQKNVYIFVSCLNNTTLSRLCCVFVCSHLMTGWSLFIVGAVRGQEQKEGNSGMNQEFKKKKMPVKNVKNIQARRQLSF